MTFDYKTSQAYMRDSFVPFSQATVSIGSSPVLYGLAVYTVFAANWNSAERTMYLYRLKEHYERLRNSARIMDFAPLESIMPFEEFETLAKELVTRNNLQEDALIRCSLFIDEELAGTKIHGLKTSFSAYVYPMGEILPRSGAHVCVSSWQRTPDNAIPSRAKINGSYVNASLMKNEALLNGYDDAISIDEHGHVAEGTVANLFLVRAGALITPDSSTDILEGITRSSILEIAEKLAIPIQQRSVDRSELYMADEVFFCGSSARITPILSIDKHPVGVGKIGEVTKMLSDAYAKIQHGENPEFIGWLTKVD